MVQQKLTATNVLQKMPLVFDALNRGYVITLHFSPKKKTKKPSLLSVIQETEANYEEVHSIDDLFTNILGPNVQHQVLKPIQKRSQKVSA